MLSFFHRFLYLFKRTLDTFLFENDFDSFQITAALPYVRGLYKMMQLYARNDEDFALKTNFKGYAEAWFDFQVKAPMVSSNLEFGAQPPKPWENQQNNAHQTMISMRCDWETWTMVPVKRCEKFIKVR